MSLQNRFHKLLKQTECIPVGSRVLVAVSGGADSVALLSLLRAVSDAMDLHLEVAHLDHALRESSPLDARFVEQLCAEYAVPLTVDRQDVAAIAKRRKGNLEEVARDVRRDFLVRVARERDCALIALGQHLDDQAETFLMRLMRGSGTTGLAGMRLSDGGVVRPLLSLSRSEIVDYLESEGLSWREDESNSDVTYTRNRIRHELVPLLQSFNPGIAASLAGLCSQMQQDDEYWCRQVNEVLARIGEWQDDFYVMDRQALVEMPLALSSRVVRGALKEVLGGLRGVATVHVEDVLCLARSAPPQGELDLPGGWVGCRYDKLLFGYEKPRCIPPFELMLDGVGTYELPRGGVLKVTEEPHPLGEDKKSAEFCLDGLSFPLRVRSCRGGDRLRPAGMDGTKKLQDLFVDLKLTKEERQQTLLLAKDDEVLWVIGLRRSGLLRPAGNEPVLRLVAKL